MQEGHNSVCCFKFTDTKIFAGYEDGLVCSYSMENGDLMSVMVGHVNRINSIELVGETLFTASNDCTVRQWDFNIGSELQVYKFADPVFSIAFIPELEILVAGCWDHMVRFLDLKQ